MNGQPANEQLESVPVAEQEIPVVVAEVVDEPTLHGETRAPQPPEPKPRRLRLPILLFVATCLCTFATHWAYPYNGLGFWASVGGALLYAGPLMFILICHEMGHFLQARRHGVHTSYPYFIPMPFGYLGTVGAVIGMDPRIPNRRALFDIGVSGPLAGLVPTILFCIVGLQWSEYRVGTDQFGDPLILSWLAHWVLGPQPAGHVILIHPTAFAGWVGLLLTAVNLMPIGQLDGGHVLYSLLRTKAYPVASALLLGALFVVIWDYERYFVWTLMLFLMLLMGPIHPPTANDDVPIGPVRTAIGWLTLAFLPLGFTPTPFIIR